MKRAAMAAALCATACNPTMATKFPPGLEPVDAQNHASEPPAEGRDPFPERISFAMGKARDWEWVHGKGFIKAPIAKVWQALREPATCTDRRNVDAWTATFDVEPGYRVSFRVHHVVHSIFDVEFDNTWRQDLASGTAEKPEVVAGAWQKTDGTSYIEVLAGSFVLRKLDEGTTSIEVMEHLSALGKGAESARAFLQDMFDSALALAHDQPLPRLK